MANKANTDGQMFQQHLYYYVIGLIHSDYDYAILYEGDDKVYKALDDVILRIEPNEQASINKGLYLFQAKQKIDSTKTMSIDDLLHYDVQISKYIRSYNTFMKSSSRIGDERPTEMIYWTSYDFYTTTKEFIEEHVSVEPHLTLTIESITKYKIKHWKSLFMYDTAHKLASQCLLPSPSKSSTKKITYINDSIIRAIAHEILECANETDPSVQETVQKVKFREQFLDGASNLSENASAFRKSFRIACKIIKNNPRNPFELDSLKAATFSTDVFDLKSVCSDVEQQQSGFSFEGLDEEELNWFFQHFIFYVNVPKNETMVEAIKVLFNKHFNDKLFELFLIDKKPNYDHFTPKAYVTALIKVGELKLRLDMPPPKGVKFNSDSRNNLSTKIEHMWKENSREITIVAKPRVEWTTARVTEVKKSLVVRKLADLENVLNVIKVIQLVDYDNSILRDEIQSVVLSDVPDIALRSRQIVDQLPQSVKVISIIPDNSEHTTFASVLQDVVELCDVEVNDELLENKYVIVDAKSVPFASFLSTSYADSIEKIVEVSDLKTIVVKSDIYEYDEQHYVERNLVNEKGNAATHDEVLGSAAKNKVSIICDTAGQGKTVELLRIAKIARDLENNVCVYLRAKTIACAITQTEKPLSMDALTLFLKLLHIIPQSDITTTIVSACLKHMNLYVLVDGFDEIVEKCQEEVSRYLVQLQKLKPCSLVIATRIESKPLLKKNFKTASFYSLGKFSYEKYFQQLWLGDKTAPSPEFEENVNIFISKFDQLLKNVGCKSFLEVPQLCKIMGSIYHDRIKKPNIQWHNNYEIGSIYDAFVQSQFVNTLRGKFDDTDKLHVWAKDLMSREFYSKHLQLAYELEYNYYKKLEDYEQLARFGLIMIQFESSECVEFMHRTVLEYFLVRYCILHDVEKEDFFTFLDRYFCVSRANIADKFIDFFLADLDRLTAKKRSTFGVYVRSNSNILATSIRMTLNNATFNTLRLLLAVSSKRTLSDLYFRFGGTGDKSGSNEINLKRLGERQTIMLLEALKERDNKELYYEDNDSISSDDDETLANDDNRSLVERFLCTTDAEEEDTLEVSIRKPFPEVFDWVVKYFLDNYNERIGSYIRGRILRYSQVLIRHCYAENKEKIIDKIRTLCNDKTLNGEIVRNCLKSFDVVGELLANIEVVPQGKSFKEPDRLELSDKIISLLDQFLQEDELRVIKQQSEEKIETLKNEAIKSRLMHWVKE